MTVDLRRYLDLYLAESQEHLRALDQALLAIEDGAAEGIENAFRATHTIKGMSATMGFIDAAKRAHALEDTLDRIRTGELSVSPEIVDSLLADADGLGRAVHEAVRAGVTVEAPAEAAAPGDDAAAASGVAAPAVVEAGRIELESADSNPEEAGVLRVVVRFRTDTPFAAARALVLRRLAAEAATLLGTEPAEIGEAFDGELTLRFDAEADRAAIEKAIQRAGDVESFVFEEPAGDARAPGAGDLPGTAGAGAASKPAAPSRRSAAAGAPLRAGRLVRIAQSRLDELAAGVGELVQLRARLAALVVPEHGTELEELQDRLERLTNDLQQSMLEARMVPVAEVFDRLPRVVRDAARSSGKEVDFRVEGGEIQIDRSILEELAEPLMHLLRNAVDHGIEAPSKRTAAGKPARGRLTLRALRLRSSVLIEVEDDGAGVNRTRMAAKLAAEGRALAGAELTDDQVLRILTEPGFSTAERVTDVSGRGVGLDAVATRIRALGGAVQLKTREGAGTTFALRLPVTLALTRALRVGVGDEDYAIPLTHIAEAVELSEVPIASVRGSPVLQLRGEVIPLIRLRSALQVGDVVGADAESAAVIVETGARRVALAVDRLVGHESIIVKSFDAPAGMLPYFSGVTLLTEGRPALVLDPVSVL